MVGILAIAALAGTTPLCPAAATQTAPLPASRSVVQFDIVPPNRSRIETLRELYEQGEDFDTFLNGAEARRALWLENWGAASVADPLLERARAVPGVWRILAVAVDSCSDSVNTIPFVAKLAELVPGIDVRIIDSGAGRPIMEGHRTPDDRAATPTLLLLDEQWQPAGCWVERPLKLQNWYAGKQKELPLRELTEQKMEWYRNDAGHETLEEVVAMIEGAAAGHPVCAPGLAVVGS